MRNSNRQPFRLRSGKDKVDGRRPWCVPCVSRVEMSAASGPEFWFIKSSTSSISAIASTKSTGAPTIGRSFKASHEPARIWYSVRLSKHGHPL